MDENELLTVAQVAALLGISRRAIYKQIADGKAQGYLVMQGGQKLLHRQYVEVHKKKREPSEPRENSTNGSPVLTAECELLLRKLDAIEGLLKEMLERMPEKSNDTNDLQPELPPMQECEPKEEPKKKRFSLWPW